MSSLQKMRYSMKSKTSMFKSSSGKQVRVRASGTGARPHACRHGQWVLRAVRAVSVRR